MFHSCVLPAVSVSSSIEYLFVGVLFTFDVGLFYFHGTLFTCNMLFVCSWHIVCIAAVG